MAIDLCQQPVGDVGDVTATLTQRGQSDRECGEPIEEVFAERSASDGLMQVAIRGRDHSDVGGSLAMIADSAKRARTAAGSHGRLKHSQQLRLRFQITLADFVQKQRAAVSQLERSWAVAIGSGEGSFDMAEEFRFQEGLRQRGAVDRHEGSVSTWAGLVDGVREHLFARAALAEQQDRSASQGGSLRAADDVANHAALADNVLEPGDVLWAFRRQMLKMTVGVSQEIRQHVDRQVERNFRDPGLPSELEAAGSGDPRRARIASLAEQQPHGRHRRSPRTQMQTKFGVAPSRSLTQLREFGIGDAINRHVVRRLGQFDGNDGRRLRIEPFQIPLISCLRIVAQQPDFVELLGGQQSFLGALVGRVGCLPANPIQDLLALRVR